MNIKPFLVEEWMNEYELKAEINIAETCVDSISLEELFSITGEDIEKFMNDFSKKRMTYGHIEGNPNFLNGICKLYKNITPENIVTTHGAIGANHHVFFSLINNGDEVVSIMPTYQQLYSIPDAYGANVKILKLKKENNYLPDIDELKKLVTTKTKLICLNNPNNPTGALIPDHLMEKIINVARSVNAYILCDEVYRNLLQEEIYQKSIADLYERGISVSGMSKVFSLAGIRLGWIATKDELAIKAFKSHRDYNHISGSMFDEEIGGIALFHSDKLLNRSKSVIKNNLEALDEWIANENHLSYVKPKAGTTALIHYDFNIDSYTFCNNLLNSTGAFVTPGDAFGEEKSFRIGYACEYEELLKGLNAISEYIKSIN